MAQSRYYSSTAQPTVLTSGITSTQVTINVVAVTGFPASTPFILALDYNTPSEEIVLVTAQAGTTLTVTRAYDGTSGTSHNSGAGVRHTWTAADGNDSRAHEGSSTGVHGIQALSSVVGTIDVQTLSNKTLIAPVLTSPSISGPVFTGSVSFPSGFTAGSTNQFQVDASGNLATANNMNTGAWVSYTPTWTSTGTAPSLGNGTLVSKFCQIGRSVRWKGQLVAGSTTTGGTGLWFMSLPVPQATAGSGNFTELGNVNYIAGGNNYVGLVSINPTDLNKATFIAKSSFSNVSFDNVSGSVPVATATGNIMLWDVVYESAS